MSRVFNYIALELCGGSITVLQVHTFVLTMVHRARTRLRNLSWRFNIESFRCVVWSLAFVQRGATYGLYVLIASHLREKVR